jgi:hypothetical protein
VAPGSIEAHAFTYLNYNEAAKTFGKVGGFSHLRTLIKKLRAEHGPTTHHPDQQPEADDGPVHLVGVEGEGDDRDRVEKVRHGEQARGDRERAIARRNASPRGVRTWPSSRAHGRAGLRHGDDHERRIPGTSRVDAGLAAPTIATRIPATGAPASGRRARRRRRRRSPVRGSSQLVRHVEL